MNSTECWSCGASGGHLSRCGRCKEAMYCSRACQRDAFRRHKLMCAAPLPLHTPMERVLEQLRERGWAQVHVPGSDALMSRCIAQLRRLFELPASLKNSWRVAEGQQEGKLAGMRYLTPFPGLHELVEMKQQFRQDSCRTDVAAVQQMFLQLRRLGIQVLREAVRECGVAEYEAPPMSASTFRCINYDRVVGNPERSLDDIASHFPSHTDSSFLTVAPRSSLPALEMREFDTLEWTCVEDALPQDHLVVFMGDCGAFLTQNRYKAPLHRPSVDLMSARQLHGIPTRISTPFFLRGDPRATIVPVLAGAQALTVEHIDKNVGGCRDAFPWKQDSGAYYADNKYSE